MKGKVVWITGASSGIGEALAYHMAEKGTRLVLSARRKDELERVRGGCDPESSDILVLPLDMTDTGSHQAAVDKVIDRFGTVDIMIHNAGISSRSYILPAAFEVFRKVMEVNYFGTVSLTKALLPAMIGQGGGHFVVMSSLMGKFSSPGRAAYAASKHAMEGFFNALRMEHYHDHILVTIACPGFVRTNVTRNTLTSDGRPQGVLDRTTAEGMDPAKAARKIARAIEKKKREVLFGGIEILGVYLKRFWPGLLTRMVLANRKKWEVGDTVE